MRVGPPETASPFLTLFFFSLFDAATAFSAGVAAGGIDDGVLLLKTFC
jgi:hypothetical protein